jgi:hypothetical protein
MRGGGGKGEGGERHWLTEAKARGEEEKKERRRRRKREEKREKKKEREERNKQAKHCPHLFSSASMEVVMLPTGGKLDYNVLFCCCCCCCQRPPGLQVAAHWKMPWPTNVPTGSTTTSW